MKVSSLPNLNRETSFPNFFTLFQHPADPDDNDTTVNKRPKTNGTEPSETSPFKGILSTSLSSGEMNENHHRIVGYFPDCDQMDWPPSPNGPDTNFSVGSNPFEDILCPFNSFDTEASAASPFKDILSQLNSSEASEAMNEIGFLEGTNSVGLIRRESVQTLPNTSSVGSNWYSGDGSATSGSVGPNPTQLWWWDQSSHPDFPESESRRTFKMSKSTFEFICSELDPVINKDIPVRQRVAVCIWWLSTGDPLRLVSNRFGLGISTCRKAVLEVCEAIRSVLMSKFLKWPDEGKMTEVKREFELVSGIPNVGGSMYTTHVPITKPEVNGPAYFNKRLSERNWKTSYSTTVQGVVDSKGVFTDVCIGWPGSMSDDKILEKSALSQRASRGLLKDVWIVGNGGYPLMDWVLVPYTKQDTWRTTRVLNEKVGEIERVVKEAFSRLKGRWSCLQKLTEVKPLHLPVVLGACCVLHNICEMRNEAMDPSETSFHLFDDEIVAEDAVRSLNALRARDQISDLLVRLWVLLEIYGMSGK
ncbi:protein ALP1-like [Rhododendron vialii]|uniref:protein ALP1-like n=1 Tax=Rhododendron vialii TaxID=182163 RepID=UPI00265E8400|nr:protein ALP1-like [Rhododendron vialii]